MALAEIIVLLTQTKRLRIFFQSFYCNALSTPPQLVLLIVFQVFNFPEGNQFNTIYHFSVSVTVDF